MRRLERIWKRTWLHTSYTEINHYVYMYVYIYIFSMCGALYACIRTRRKWEDNIKKDLQEVGWGHGLD
jgi:hypothetical protein